jgi:hypothetical protein
MREWGGKNESISLEDIGVGSARTMRVVSTATLRLTGRKNHQGGLYSAPDVKEQ